nr:unnamed protein product [Callosobruchus chinensis]
MGSTDPEQWKRWYEELASDDENEVTQMMKIMTVRWTQLKLMNVILIQSKTESQMIVQMKRKLAMTTCIQVFQCTQERMDRLNGVRCYLQVLELNLII